MPSQQMPSLNPNISLASLLPKRGSKQTQVDAQTDSQGAAPQGSAPEGAAAPIAAPKASGPRLALPSLSGSLSLKRKRTTVVGLDIQPGYVAAARAHLNGGIVIDRAAWAPLEADTVREGEILNEEALAHTLRELFSSAGLDRHVRIGVANQRTVMRTLEVPPLTDQKELATAVRFQAEDQMPMPLSNAAIDFRPLGIVDTPDGARQRVLLVATLSDTVTRLLGAVKAAGLQPEGIDLSAFALIRSLHKRGIEYGEAGPPRVLHLNVGGLTNMVIAEGVHCHFTRVLSRGLEAIASEVAERRAVPINQARGMLRSAGLGNYAGAQGAPAGGAISMMGGSGAPSGGVSDVEALAVQMEEERAREQASTVDEFPTAPAEEPIAEVAPAPPLPVQDDAEGAAPHLTALDGGAGASAEAPSGEVAYDAEGHLVHVDHQPAEETQYSQYGDDFAATGEESPGTEPAPLAGAESPQAGAEQGFAAAPAGEGAFGAPEAAPEAFAPQAEAPEAAPVPVPEAPAAEAAPPQPAGRIEVNEQAPSMPAEDLAEIRVVLEAGVRGIAGEVRNSLDYFQAQEGGAAAAEVVLSGPALDIPGFAELLEQNLGLPVRSETVPAASSSALNGASAQYFAIAAGLAVEEVRP